MTATIFTDRSMISWPSEDLRFGNGFANGPEVQFAQSMKEKAKRLAGESERGIRTKKNPCPHDFFGDMNGASLKGPLPYLGSQFPQSALHLSGAKSGGVFGDLGGTGSKRPSLLIGAYN